MSDPIVIVYAADGTVAHDCAAAGCHVSWDGYVLAESLSLERPDPAAPGGTSVTRLAQGDRVPGAGELGSEWDTTTPGQARPIPSAD